MYDDLFDKDEPTTRGGMMGLTNCKGCGLWKGEQFVVEGSGPKQSNVMIVGESPGKLEVHESLSHEPFIGESGGILNWALKEVGLIKYEYDRENKVYITNAVKCHPGDTTISQEHKKKCRKWIASEIKSVKPKLVLVLGGHALHTLSGDYQASIEKMRGFWYWSKEFKVHYFPTIHPAVVLRSWQATSSFLSDIENFAVGVKLGSAPTQKLGSNYKLLETIEDVRSFFSEAYLKKNVAWDLETTNLEYWNPDESIICSSLSYEGGSAVTIPFRLPGEHYKNFWPSQVHQDYVFMLLSRFLENKNIKKCGQNIKFDINWMRKYGVTVRGVDWDTMQAHHLIDENTPSNLTYLTSYYKLGFPRYEGELDKHIVKEGKKKTYKYIPLDELSTYACADADATFRIAELQRKMLSPKQKRLYYNVSTPLSKVAGLMEYNGILIDVNRIEELELEYEKNIIVENKKLSKIAKKESINVQSSPQMQELLFGSEPGSLKLKGVMKTKSGAWGTGKEVFEFLRRNYAKNKRVLKVLNLITEIRRMRKMKSTYLTGFKNIVGPGNRVHTSYITTGTVTGRLSSQHPALQNIPRDETFRKLFIAADDAWLITADYSQIEARMIAWLAREIGLIKKFADPEFDPHSYNSSIVRDKPIEEVTSEERSYDKAVTFGINYGRSIKSISDTYDIPYEFVENFVNAYFEEFSQIYKWRNAMIVKSQTEPYVLENNSGRKRRFFAYEWILSSEFEEVAALRQSIGESNFVVERIIGNMERQAMNFPIQSYSSDLLVMAKDRILKAIKAEGIDMQFRLSVHDEIVFEVSEKDKEKGLQIVNEQMPFSLSMTNGKTKEVVKMDFPIGYSIKRHWSK
jgi:DNA polymerase I